MALGSDPAFVLQAQQEIRISVLKVTVSLV